MMLFWSHQECCIDTAPWAKTPPDREMLVESGLGNVREGGAAAEE